MDRFCGAGWHPAADWQSATSGEGEGSKRGSSAGPEKRLWCCNQSRLNRIHFDVIDDPSKLSFVTNQAIIAFVLPKRSGKAQYPIGLPGRKSLERVHRFGHFDVRRNQEMDMVRHNDIRMDLEMLQLLLPVMYCIHHQLRDIRAAKVKRAGAGVIEKAIHHNEGSSRGDRGRKAPIGRKTAVQTPRQKHRPADCMQMRQAAGVEPRHKVSVEAGIENSHHSGTGRLPIGRRMPSCPTAHHV
jgi:hypothetical protein